MAKIMKTTLLFPSRVRVDKGPLFLPSAAKKILPFVIFHLTSTSTGKSNRQDYAASTDIVSCERTNH